MGYTCMHKRHYVLDGEEFCIFHSTSTLGVREKEEEKKQEP